MSFQKKAYLHSMKEPFDTNYTSEWWDGNDVIKIPHLMNTNSLRVLAKSVSDAIVRSRRNIPFSDDIAADTSSQDTHLHCSWNSKYPNHSALLRGRSQEITVGAEARGHHPTPTRHYLVENFHVQCIVQDYLNGEAGAQDIKAKGTSTKNAITS